MVDELGNKPVSIAAISLSFHSLATSAARGSVRGKQLISRWLLQSLPSGLGALNRAWMERSTVLICKAGDQFPVAERISQIHAGMTKNRSTL